MAQKNTHESGFISRAAEKAFFAIPDAAHACRQTLRRGEKVVEGIAHDVADRLVENGIVLADNLLYPQPTIAAIKAKIKKIDEMAGAFFQDLDGQSMD